MPETGKPRSTTWSALSLRDRLRNLIERIRKADPDRFAVYFNDHDRLASAREGTAAFDRIVERNAPGLVGVYDARVDPDDLVVDVLEVARGIGAGGRRAAA